MQSEIQTFESCRVQLEKVLQQPDADPELGSQEQELESGSFNAALELLDTMVHVIELQAKKFHLFDEREFTVIFNDDWHQLRNFADLMRIKVQLLKPRDLEDFRGALFWLTQWATKKELELIKKVRSNPPYNSKEIQRLLYKAQCKAEPQPIESEALTPETMIAIAEIKDYAPDQPLQMGQSYYLQAGIKGKVPENSEEKASSSDGEKQGVQLQIVVWAEDMEIKPDWVQFYELYEDRETSFIEFELEPNQLGQKNIRVQFYYQRHWLGEVKFETQVIEAKRLVIA